MGIRIYYDGMCPICRASATKLARLDGGRGRITLVDASDPAFDPTETGVDRDQLLRSVHGLLPDGRLVRGLEVFRRAYAISAKGWLIAFTGWPIVKPLFDFLYDLVAKHRPRDACNEGSCARHRHRS